MAKRNKVTKKIKGNNAFLDSIIEAPRWVKEE